MEARVEDEPEDVAARRALGLERGARLRGHGQVALAAEIEGLQPDLDRLAVLVAEAQPEPAQRVRRHRSA